MGKATIFSGGADGQYTVRLDYGKAKRDTTVVRIIARMGELVPAIAALQQQVDEQQAAEDAQKAAVEAAIDAYVAATQAVAAAAQAVVTAQQTLATVSASPTATPAQKAAAQAQLNAAKTAQTAAQNAVKPALEAHTQAMLALLEAKKKTAGLHLVLDILKIEQSKLEKDLGYWQGLVLEKDMTAWCADLTESATGTVATIEIPGEDKLVLIAPAAPAHNPTVDGILTAREVQTDAQVFFNAAILPGWQKYKPTYRRGTITAINAAADTADVLLEVTDKSSAQKLIINQTPTLEAVPVQYMACNAGAFEVGDRCVVKFTAQDWAQPKIVGFVDNPKSCGAVLAGISSSSAHRLGYAPPGKLGGASLWDSPFMGAMPASLQVNGTGHAEQQPGSTTWTNPDIRIKHQPVVVSWRGDDHRYSRYNNWNYPNPPWEEGFVTYFGNRFQFPDSEYIWVNGFKVMTPVRKVIAAALYRPDPEHQPERVVLRICTDEFPIASGLRQLGFVDCEKAGPDPTLTLWDLCNTPALVVTASQAGPLTNGPIARYIQQRPHYNKSATKIAALFDHDGFKFAATVDVVTGELVKFFEPTHISTFSHNYTEEGAFTPAQLDPPIYGSLVSYTTSTTEYSHFVSQIVHAVDFLGDTPVAIYAEITGGHEQSANGNFIYLEYPYPDGPQAWSESTTVEPGSVKLIHTQHGQLLEKTYEAVTGPVVNVLNLNNGIFLGDLSKDMFAFGLAKTSLVRTATSSDHTAVRTETWFNPQYEFSFWCRAPGALAPTKLATAVDGGYPFSRATSPTTNDMAVATEWGGMGPSLPNITLSNDPVIYTQNQPLTVTTQGQSTLPLFPAYYQHGAVDPSGRVGYFGCGQYHQGMEAVLRVKNSELLTVPAYAPGAYPNTLMMPVFYCALKAKPPTLTP